uniref:RING-type E3 ubiquitin transferase n=1 Tax=Anser brachyrhynchus TaxID=132585 RepID=A0A8B9I368_9AVES
CTAFSSQCPSKSHRSFFPGPAWLRQPGYPGGVLAAADMSGGGPALLGQLGGDPGLSSFSSVTAAAAAPVRRSSPSSPALSCSPQQMESMDSELDGCCPICLDTCNNTSYVVPCLHQFCFGCIKLCIERQPKCPLCKKRVQSILHSVLTFTLAIRDSYSVSKSC